MKRRKRNPSFVDSLKKAVGLKPKKGSLTEDDARDLAESFHGRESKGKIEIAEKDNYHKTLAILGELEELTIYCGDSDSKVMPIRFSNTMGESRFEDPDCVLVCAATTSQIEFIEGDQYLEFDEKVCRTLEIDEVDLEKDFVRIGYVATIVYFTDKHHLEGPSYQKKGTSYEHRFGEDGGYSPELWYDTLNDKLLLLGGSYTITPEGIKN